MRLPANPPADVLVATWSDYLRLLRIAVESQFRVVRRQPAYGWLFAVLALVIVAEGVWFGSLVLSTAAAFVFPALVALLVVVFLLGHTAMRLIDPRRLVLLSSTRGAGLDIRFGSTVAPSNHGRIRGDRSAPELRTRVAYWVRSLPIDGLRFQAQNAKVAALYKDQVPELVVGRTNALGYVELTYARDGA